MSFNLVQWWHDLIDHLFKHPAAAEVAHPAIAAVATTLQPAPVLTNPTVTIPGTAGAPGFQLDAGMARILGVNQQSTDILNSRVGQSAPQANLDPGTIYFDHHTMVTAGSYKLEPGKARLSLTYTSQDAGKVAPSAAWANFGSGEIGPMQAGTEASFDVPDGATSALIRFDTDGRMIGQLFAV